VANLQLEDIGILVSHSFAAEQEYQEEMAMLDHSWMDFFSLGIIFGKRSVAGQCGSQCSPRLNLSSLLSNAMSIQALTPHINERREGIKC
jgi:hypothetical protein